MQYRSLLIILFAFLVFNSFGQEKISDIENIAEIYFNTRGFVEHDGVEYTIVRGEKTTEVSIIEDGEVNHLHSMSYRPIDGRSRLYDVINLDIDLVSYKIYNASGVGVLFEKNNDNKAINVSKLSKGFYTISGVDLNGNTRNGSFIIHD